LVRRETLRDEEEKAEVFEARERREEWGTGDGSLALDGAGAGVFMRFSDKYAVRYDEVG
jgi:hypothetical protein